VVWPWKEAMSASTASLESNNAIRLVRSFIFQNGGLNGGDVGVVLLQEN
jgi:hypothetical protein